MIYINKFMSKDKDNQLIWESYVTRAEAVEDEFFDWADENPSKKPQPSKSSSLKLNRPPEKKELDDYGREYIYKAPKRGHSSEEEMIQVLKQMPQGMGDLFKPDKEGSFYVLTPSDKFESFNSTGDGMGEIEEHDLGYALVGLADGNFLEYIKYPPMEEEDPDADLFRQSDKDYKRSEGIFR